MTRTDELAAAYLAARPRLVGVAYAVLGTRSEAEDVVSDVWLRLVDADARSPVLDVDAWATVVTARAALDAYRSARRRRERYVGPWLPEPLLDAAPGADPADRVTLDEQVSFALLVVLESLTPAERTAWVLHDLFELPFAEVAEAVGRRPEAVRQLAARARAHLRDQAPRVPVDAGEHDRVVQRFLTAAAGGDLAGLVAVLDPQVTLTSDGGGEVSAARRPVHGADNVARFVLGLSAKATDEEVRVVRVNGATGVALFRGDTLTGVVALTVAGGRISRVDFVRAPAKLGGRG
jgi:RNA polymerase sigma-70 factor (ECF subfamily)